jgi:glycosyltransferase involved in cell wall biosynthesis
MSTFGTSLLPRTIWRSCRAVNVQSRHHSSVTVAIPTRDRTEFLHESIASILRGTVRAEKILVVDNSQLDPGRTEAICREFGESVTYLAPLANLTMQANHNRALRSIETQYSCILHDDDTYSRDFLERGIDALSSNDRAAFFAVNYGVIDEQGREKQAHAWPKFDAGTHSGIEFLSLAMASRSPAHFSASVLRTEFATRCALAEADGNCADMGFFFQMACHGEVILEQDALAQVRVHGGMESAREGYFGFRGGRRSEVLAIVPLEWETKRRFLHSEKARSTYAPHIAALEKNAARTALRAIACDLKRRHVRLSDRLGLLRAAAPICPAIFQR